MKTRLSGKQDFHLKKWNAILRLGLYFFKLHMPNAITKDLVERENNDANVQSTKRFLSGCWFWSIYEGPLHWELLVQDGSVGRGWTHLLPGTRQIYTYSQSNAPWRRTESCLNSFCITNKRETTQTHVGEPETPHCGHPSQHTALQSRGILGGPTQICLPWGTAEKTHNGLKDT